MRPGANQGRDGSPHVVGGTTEYLSTMRRLWVAILGGGWSIGIEYEQKRGLPPPEGPKKLSVHENKC
jgi:hypothetical protein